MVVESLLRPPLPLIHSRYSRPESQYESILAAGAGNVKRVEAYGEGLRRSGLSRDSRGSGRALSQRHREKVEGVLSPLARVGENGEISWVPIMEMTILAARSND